MGSHASYCVIAQPLREAGMAPSNYTVTSALPTDGSPPASPALGWGTPVPLEAALVSFVATAVGSSRCWIWSLCPHRNPLGAPAAAGTASPLLHPTRPVLNHFEDDPLPAPLCSRRTALFF